MRDMTIAGGAEGTTEAGRTGLVLRDPLPWEQAVEVVQIAEETGYEAVFVPEIDGREAFATLAGFAVATTRIRLGTGVVTMWSRDPVTTAMGAATVHELSEGRMILGIGVGTASMFWGPPPGPPESPLDRVRRYVRLVRAIVAGRTLGAEEGSGAASFRLGLEPVHGRPPVWLGALGNGMIALAGEIAEGVLLNWCTPERVVQARTLVSRAAEDGGRDPAEVTVAVYVRACLGVEEAIALDALREMTGRYAAIPHYLRQMERMGLGEDAALAAKAFEAGRPQEVPEPLVRALTVRGGRREALERFAAYREAGADLVLCYPVSVLEPLSSILGTLLAAAPSPAVEH
jgi:alkanesulfonate monooxygenase SsuD/methylene tetrahydromethanopterin reductase-like flavin-dependent oxidoreductase (luciferase family)